MRELKQTQLTYYTPAAPSRKQLLQQRTRTDTPLIKLRDGEVVLYRRAGTTACQCRYRLKEYGWIRRSTRTANIEVATQQACEWYDEARYRQRAGLAPEVKRFKDVALLTLQYMRRDIAGGTGKRVYADYCRAIEQYFIPFFGNKYLTNITHTDVQAFEAWRNQQLQRTQPGKPQQNAYVERFNRTVRYEWLSQYHWAELDEVRDFATQWMWHYNHDRPNMALGGITPKQRLAMAA